MKLLRINLHKHEFVNYHSEMDPYNAKKPGFQAGF